MGKPPKRSTILGMLTVFSMVSYVERVNISVAAQLMMPDLSLTQIQMGQIFSSFMIGYCIFQLPAGRLGDRLGPTLVLTVSACLWGVLTALTGFMPGKVVGLGTGTYIVLLVLRFLLGSAEAATYPVAARAVANWSPPSKRGIGNALVIAGLPIGSAITPPFVSWLMVHIGWRQTFYITATFAFIIALAWICRARDYPENGSVIGDRGGFCGTEISRPPSFVWHSVFRSRNVLLICLSYFFEGYVLFMFVFWLYIYLVEVRGFSILSGGLFASAPWVLSVFTTPAGGLICDSFGTRYGRLFGSKLVVMSTYFLSAVLLLFSAHVNERHIAIAGLSFSVAFLMSAEAAFWSGIVHVAGENPGAASGLMNSAGIVGGVVSTSLVPILAKYFGWPHTLAIGSVASAACALMWLGIRETKSRQYLMDTKQRLSSMDRRTIDDTQGQR